MLVIGNGTSLAPLVGIVREALAADHRGEIHLYHGTRHPDGLYLDHDLRDLAARNRTIRYAACLSGTAVPPGCRA